MILESRVRETFAPHGALSQAADQFQPRAGQTEMALAVAQTLESGGALVVEAGTGVGKSAAYASTMVALALALKTRLLISTATVALQEQLMGKDLPALAAVLETPFAFALAKKL